MLATQDTPTTEATEALTAAAAARAIGNASFAYDPDKDSAVLKAREELKAAFLKDGTPLARLGDALLAAYVDECRWSMSTDEAQIGREVTAEEHQRHLTAIDTTFAALRAVGAYKPSDLIELTQKAALLKIGVDGDPDVGFDIEGTLDADRQRLDVTCDFLETMTDIFAVLAVVPADHRQAFADGAAKAKSAETRQGWAKIAKLVKGLHRQVTFGDGKAEDDQSVVGKAYRAARAAASPKTHFLKAIEAHEAVERIAKSFCEDGTYANYAVNPTGISHIASLVGALQQAARDLNRETSPAMMGGVGIQRVFWPAGHTSNRELRNAWDAAQAARAANRAPEEDDLSPEGKAAHSAAERGVYLAAAPDLKAVLWKVGENLIEELGTFSIEEALFEAEHSSELSEVCQAAVYRDLERLAGVDPVVAVPKAPIAPRRPPLPDAQVAAEAFGPGDSDPAQDFDLLSAIGELMHINDLERSAKDIDDLERLCESKQPFIDQAIATRAKTIAGLMGRVWLVEDRGPRADSLDYHDLEWCVVRSLLDDIKALFRDAEPRTLIGSEAITAQWTAAKAANLTGAISPPTPQLLAAE